MNARFTHLREKLEQQFALLEGRIAGAAPVPAEAGREALLREKQDLAGRLAQAQAALEAKALETARLKKDAETAAAQREQAVSLRERENRALGEQARRLAAENERLQEELRFLRAETAARRPLEDEMREKEALLAAKNEEVVRLFARLREFENEREQLYGEIETLRLRRHHRHSRRHGEKQASSPGLLAWLATPVLEIGTKSGR